MAGNLYIVAAPSGAGKTTLVRRLLAEDSAIRLSISYTTRTPRTGEENGREYHFVDVATFKKMIAQGDFLEWAEVHGNFYGTSKSWISSEMAAGRDVLLEIDWQGAQQVRQHFPQAIGVFILPPSLEVLAQRLRGRGTDAEEVIARRLAAAGEEMRHVGEFDYVIINDDLEQALADLLAVSHATRLTFTQQQQRYTQLFSQLISQLI